MSGEFSIAEAPIASAAPFTGVIPVATYFFDPAQTVLSQYANSPVLLSLIDDFAQWLDPASRFDAFFSLLWDIDTAVGYGLDVWGRILGVVRTIQVPAGIYLGFTSDPAARPFGFGILYGGARNTNNVILTDDAYRLLLLAKAALNITNASIPAINSILLNLFGQGYVVDNLDMSMKYKFPNSLTPLEQAIVSQSGALPKPCGVSFTAEAP